MLVYIFSAIIVLAQAVMIYIITSKRKLPGKNYTLFDDITEGKSGEDKENKP